MLMQAVNRTLRFPLFAELLTGDEQVIRDRVPSCCAEEVIPIGTSYVGRAECLISSPNSLKDRGE